MLFENVNTYVFDCLKKNGYFMYHIPAENDSRYDVYNLPTGRILSIYYDTIVVYNFDKKVKTIASSMAPSLVPFKIVNIDNYDNIFALPVYIEERVIDLIRMSSPTALRYVDDNVCQAISLAFSELSLYSLYREQFISSDRQFPQPVQEEFNVLMDEGGLFRERFSKNLIAPKRDPSLRDITPDCNSSEYGVVHTRPLEEIHAFFNPEEIGCRGRAKAGFSPDESMPFDDIPPGTKPAAWSYTEINENKDIVRAEIDYSVRVNGYKIHPVLIQVVDEISEEEKDTKQFSNPIGFIEEKKSK